MSNKVWHNILEPIVLRILQTDPQLKNLFSDRGGHRNSIEDQRLEQFVLTQLQNEFGVAGQVATDAYGRLKENVFCEALEISLKELLAEEDGDIELEEILKKIVSLYIKLGVYGTKQEILETAREVKERKTIPNPYFKPIPWANGKKKKVINREMHEVV